MNGDHSLLNELDKLKKNLKGDLRKFLDSQIAESAPQLVAAGCLRSSRLYDSSREALFDAAVQCLKAASAKASSPSTELTEIIGGDQATIGALLEGAERDVLIEAARYRFSRVRGRWGYVDKNAMSLLLDIIESLWRGADQNPHNRQSIVSLLHVIKNA